MTNYTTTDEINVFMMASAILKKIFKNPKNLVKKSKNLKKNLQGFKSLYEGKITRKKVTNI